MTATIRCLCLLLLAPSGVAYAQNNDDLVPVMVIDPPPVLAPLRPDATPKIILGMVSSADIEDGLPYRVGFYQLEQDVHLGSWQAQWSASALRARPICKDTPAVLNEAPCMQVEALLAPPAVDGKGAAAKLGYQFSGATLSSTLEVSQGAYAASLNPSVPWPSNDIAITWLGDLSNVTLSRRALTLSAGFESPLGGEVLLGATRSRSQLDQRYTLDNSRLSIQWLYGSLGFFVGANRFDLGSSSSQALDFGMSWQTPWRGKLQIGTRQAAKTPRLLDPNQAALVADDLAPMPYVHYEQDL